MSKLPQALIDRSLELLKDAFRSKQQAYIKTFSGPVARVVLADLAQFCRASETTFHTDPRLHAVLEGRREVWLKIQTQLNLTPDELYELHIEAKNKGRQK